MSLNPGDEDSHSRWDQDARNSVFIKRSSDNHNNMSDSESSVGDSLWSGSASSSWMSTPSLSAIRPSDLYMSSLPAQKQVVVQATLSTSADSSAESWISNDGRQSEGFNTPVTPPSHSKKATTQPEYPAAFHTNPRNQVDYLSYDWTLEDISASWRYIALNKKTHPKGERLEYASWRAWEKLRSKLHTVTPESLNWLKDSDDTWLYGPFKRASPKVNPKGFRRQALANQSLSSTPSSTGILLTRPILKKSASIDTVKETVVLLRSLSAGSLANRDISVLQWRKKLKPNNKSPPPQREVYTSTTDPQYSPEAASPRKEHVHFKFQENKAEVLNKDNDGVVDLLQPHSKGPARRSDLARTPDTKWSFKSKLGGSKDWDKKTSYPLNCDHDHASDIGPKKDFASPPNSSTPPKRQNGSLFFLDDSEDEDFEVCAISGEEKYSHDSNSKVAESPGLGYNAPSPDPTPASLMPVNTPLVPNTAQTFEPEKDPYWLIFHSAMSRLQAIPLLKPDNAYMNGGMTDTITWVKSANFDSDHSSTSPFYTNPNTRFSSKKRCSPSAYTVSRLLSLRGQEAEECFGDFHFGSVPPQNRFDEEDDDADFQIRELDLPSTGADLSEWILQKRRRHWWFVNEGVATSTLDSTQEDFMPSLTQIPPRPSNNKFVVEATVSDETSVNKITKTDDALNWKSKLSETEPSQVMPIDELVSSEKILLQPHIIHSLQPIPEESADLVMSPQNIGYTIIDLDSGTTKHDEVEMDGCETMTDSCEDDSLGSVDSDSLYDDCGAMKSDHYTHDECLDSALAPMQQELVNKIMAEFWIIFNQTWSKGIQQCTTEPTESRDRKQSTGSTISDSSSSPLSPRKRRRRDDEPPDDRKDKGKEAGGSDDPTSARGEFEETIRFACPFRKHDPHFYNVYDHSVCVLSNWSTIARVKEHLYRAHRMPIHCKRCWYTFKSQDLLDAHLTVATSKICDLKPGIAPQGLTPAQERRLKSRKKSSSNQSNGDRWREVYEILFPNEEIPSPYYEYIPEETHMSPESRELANYEAYMRRELPRLVRRNIEDIVRQALGPLHSSLIGDFVGIVRDSQDAAFRSYRQSQGLGDELPQPPDPIPALRFGLVGSEDESSLDPASNIQQPGLITAMFQAPPSQSSDSMLSMQMMDDVQSRSSINEIRSEPDSGYASEETLPCGCLHFCQCPNNNTATRARGAIDIAVREYPDGDIPWNAEWATYPDWNQLECVGGTFEWQNGG